MIRVRKSATAPAPLGSSGKRHRQQLEERYEANPAACHVPDNKVLEARGGIYKDDRVKQRLRDDQYNKCCYCETKDFTSTSFGDVEHFRPKGGFQQERTDTLEKPGYYWLAYEWSNLYFACTRCNSDYKGNYFPLRNPAARARSHADVLSLEQPLLPDPATEDPSRHLTFKEDAVEPLDERGLACVEAFGLDRPDLIKQRIAHLKALHNARIVGAIDLSVPLKAKTRKFLRDFNLTLAEAQDIVTHARLIWAEAAFDSAPFAGMVRAKFPHLPTR